jgi:site-specific DNA-adenine methylase
MRKYGGKSANGHRIAKVLKQFMKKHKGKYKNYVEPFCGMWGVGKHLIKKLHKYGIKAYASDGCEDLILLLREIRDGTFKDPGYITKQRWYQLKYSTIPSAERAVAGFGYSYMGVWFNGYLADAFHDPNYLYTNLLSFAPLLEKVKMRYSDYHKAMRGIKGRSVIYCDPPYEGSACKFGSTYGIDHKAFKRRVKKWKQQGHAVFISSHEFPMGKLVLDDHKFNTRKGSFYADRLFKL